MPRIARKIFNPSDGINQLEDLHKTTDDTNAEYKKDKAIQIQVRRDNRDHIVQRHEQPDARQSNGQHHHDDLTDRLREMKLGL